MFSFLRKITRPRTKIQTQTQTQRSMYPLKNQEYIVIKQKKDIIEISVVKSKQ